MDEPELERRMREGLEQHAARTDVDRAPELVATARRDASARPWRTGAGIGLAAAAVAGIAFGGVLLFGEDDAIRSGGRDATDATDSATTAQGWRTEYWRDVQVDVPDDWGWGGAPQPDVVDVESGSNGEPIDCGAEAYVAADGTRLLNGDDTMPYVGRPIIQTDACFGQVGEGRWRPPTAPYVWLGAPVGPGTVEFANGYVMETREVNGSTVSVATQDPALRRQILDSATGGETCRSEYDQPPGPDTTGSQEQEPDEMLVCAYRQDAGILGLTYATRLGQPAVVALLDSFDGAPLVEPCPDSQVSEWVVLELRAAGETVMRHVVQLGECSGVTISRGRWELTEENVTPWAVDGLPAYVVGPRSGEEWVYEHFKGILG